MPRNYKPRPVKPIQFCEKFNRSDKKADKIRVSRVTVFPATSQKAIWVTCQELEVTFQPKRKSIAEHEISTPHGVQFVRRKMLALVATFSQKYKTLPKRMIVGQVVAEQVVI